jgi:uncharacterized protein (DUF1800 family)
VKLSRRKLLRWGASAATAAGAVGLTGCDQAISWVTGQAGQGVPPGELGRTDGAAIDPVFHLLSRAAFGPWPGDVDRVRRMGVEAWIEEQLEPDAIDDRLCELRARRFESLLAPVGELYEYKKDTVLDELGRATLLRAVYSKRQLFEVMVRFWSDHLNIDISKGDCGHLKAADDRDVIRRHALGRFRDLIRASALSPAMLVYLDGTENRRRTPDEVPNENYARELMELHTLGVDGGYSQEDVMEAARCLTGWRVEKGWGKGRVVFDAHAHDDGEKVVLGTRIPAGGGEKDLDRLLDVVCNHPSTARYVATKLCRRLVSDTPPAALVTRVAGVFQETGGEIRAMVREVLLSDGFLAARGTRFKRPFRYLASALRAMAADTHAHRPLTEYLRRLGQPLFQFPTPDGYPDERRPWMGTLLWRWNVALALPKGELPGVRVDAPALARALGPGELTLARAFSYLVGRAPTPQEARALGPAWKKDPRLCAGLILASPAYQRS